MPSVYEAVVCSLTAGPERRDGVCRAEFVFREDFAGFEGHFPDNPIVPGIAQVYAAQVTAGAAGAAGAAGVAGSNDAGEGKRIRLKEAVRCKFMRPVLPGEVVRVALAGEWERESMRCKAEITANNEPCSVMTLILERAG